MTIYDPLQHLVQCMLPSYKSLYYFSRALPRYSLYWWYWKYNSYQKHAGCCQAKVWLYGTKCTVECIEAVSKRNTDPLFSTYLQHKTKISLNLWLRVDIIRSFDTISLKCPRLLFISPQRVTHGASWACIYFPTHRSTHNISATLSSPSLYFTTHFFPHASVILNI